MKAPAHGGRRRNAGRHAGTQNPGTLDKLAAREYLRERVTAALGPLVDAQIASALGLKYLVVREKKTGKFVRVTEAMARVKLGKHEEIVEVWELNPSTHAFADLMDRALDKPKEQEIELSITTGTDRVARLERARKRVLVLPE